MRNLIRTALIIGTLATPMISMADTPAKKDAPAAAAPATDKKDAAAPAKEEKKTDAKAPAKKDAAKKDAAKKDAAAPAAK